ncbi:MAG: flagellar biosynthesis repressor FlbT [Parvularcula sp.]
MSGLTLTLKPGEKFLVGGHMVENGPRRSSIKIEDDSVFVLRLSDALHPEEINTPVRRAYEVAQNILACEVGVDEGVADLEGRLHDLAPIFIKAGHEDLIVRVALAVSGRRFFGVLMALRNMFAVEAELLGLNEAAGDTAQNALQNVATG